MAAIHLEGIRGEPCGAVRWTNTALNVKKCICWCLSIIELKNARRNIESVVLCLGIGVCMLMYVCIH